jgi:hypothetical protein
MGIIPLALITNRQLGLDGWATAAESLAKALEWGLEEIISEVGLQFCLQTTENEWQVFMGMRPVINSRGCTKSVVSFPIRQDKMVGSHIGKHKSKVPRKNHVGFQNPFFQVASELIRLTRPCTSQGLAFFIRLPRLFFAFKSIDIHFYFFQNYMHFVI